MLLSRLLNGRLFPMKVSRLSSFASANAPEANLGSKEEDGNAQASLQHAFCECKHSTVDQSQQRMKSRRQARRGPRNGKSRAPRKREASRVMVQVQHG